MTIVPTINPLHLPAGFSLGQAWVFGVMAANAYDPIIARPDRSIIETEITDARTDTRVVVTQYPDSIVLAFRGTVDMVNWLVNLDVVKRGLDSQIKIHDGFLCAVNRLLPRIIDLLMADLSATGAFKPIQICGHSLGGAMASLAAFFLQRKGFPVESVHTFASPRVGNTAWRTAFNAVLGYCTWRIAAAGDLVPLIPGVLDGYRHVGQEIYLADGKIWSNPNHTFEIMRDSWRALRAMERLDWDFMKFHSMDKDYLPLLHP